MHFSAQTQSSAVQASFLRGITTRLMTKLYFVIKKTSHFYLSLNISLLSQNVNKNRSFKGTFENHRQVINSSDLINEVMSSAAIQATFTSTEE